MVNKKGAEYSPLLWCIGFILAVGVLVPLVVSSMSDLPAPEEATGVMVPFIYIVDNGACFSDIVNIGGDLNPFGLLVDIFQWILGIEEEEITFGCINPLAWLGEDIHDAFLNYVLTFSLIPNEILIPLLIIFTLIFIYGGAQLVKGFV